MKAALSEYCLFWNKREKTEYLSVCKCADRQQFAPRQKWALWCLSDFVFHQVELWYVNNMKVKVTTVLHPLVDFFLTCINIKSPRVAVYMINNCWHVSGVFSLVLFILNIKSIHPFSLILSSTEAQRGAGAYPSYLDANNPLMVNGLSHNFLGCLVEHVSHPNNLLKVLFWKRCYSEDNSWLIKWINSPKVAQAGEPLRFWKIFLLSPVDLWVQHMFGGITPDAIHHALRCPSVCLPPPLSLLQLNSGQANVSWPLFDQRGGGVVGDRG